MQESVVELMEPKLTNDTSVEEQSSGEQSLPFPRLLPPLLSGGMLYLCHFPVAWGWLAWFALVPLLTSVRAPFLPVSETESTHGKLRRLMGWFANPRARLYWCVWLGGVVFFCPVMQWLRVADPRMYLSWTGLALYCSLYFPAAIFVLRLLDRKTRLPLTLTAPVVWTALEFFRAHFGTGFPWYFFSHTQHDFLPLIQISDITGAYGVTFLLVAVNAALFEYLCSWESVRKFCQLRESPSSLRSALQGIVTAGLLCGALAYGYYRTSNTAFEPGPQIALVQGNITQDIKNRPDSHVMIDQYCDLTELALQHDRRPELLIWPETSYPHYWSEFSLADVDRIPEREQINAVNNTRAKANHSLISLVHDWQVPALIGLNAEVIDPQERASSYNSALLLRPGREAEVDGIAVRSQDFKARMSARLLILGPDALRESELSPMTGLPVARGKTVPANADAVVAWRGQKPPKENTPEILIDCCLPGSFVLTVDSLQQLAERKFPEPGLAQLKQIEYVNYSSLNDFLPRIYRLLGAFTLTQRSFEELPHVGIPAEIMATLKPLQDTTFTFEESYKKAVEDKLSPKNASLWYPKILSKTHIGVAREYHAHLADVINAAWHDHARTAVRPGQNLVRMEGRYDKIHRVPLGEYVPFKTWFPWIQKLTPYETEYGVLSGENYTRFSLRGKGDREYRFGVVICFEDSDPVLPRKYVASRENNVDFLVNISNDGWFKGTAEHEEHLAICRFRAIECRRSVVRAVNMGISAVIDGNGRVLAPEEKVEGSATVWSIGKKAGSLPVSRWAEFKSRHGVIHADVPIDRRESVYARHGDWFPWTCWGVLGLSLGLAFMSRKGNNV